jgi:small-conductance mechanosensitive channel
LYVVKLKQNGVALILVIALVVVAYLVYRTSSGDTPAVRATRRAGLDRAVAVDQSSLITAERLVRMPTTEDERQFAEDALRYADQEMDLAFAQAVRQTANQQRTLSAEAKEISAKLQQATRALTADQAQVTDLTAELAKASPVAAQSLTDRLNLAKAQAALDQDEVDDARADLRRAGGDPQGRMQEMIAEHDAASRSSDSVHVVVTRSSANDAPGLIHRVQALSALYDKESEVKKAKAAADSMAVAFKRRHDRLEARAAERLRDTAVAKLSHDSASALLASTQRRAADEKTRATLDQRTDNQHRLSDVYGGWLTVLDAQERALVNRALRGIAAIIVVVLFGILIARWIEHALGARTMDRRRTQTLYMVSRVSLQVLCALVILLIIFGPPNNLGTFLGLAGAGLTVALKDFIVGFLGWFVLMGRNGIRIGDLVEINGVTGEVIELGMFYTELLETGGWSDSGHPTGRRATFNNSFAIEGHYFNFSTSGRWLWDEVHIVVPSGQDPYALVEAMQKVIDEATADSAREAEAQWSASRRSPRFSPVSAAPSINLRPTPGGVEIVARYVTHVGEREQVRGKLYHLAVEMLGARPTVSS